MKAEDAEHDGGKFEWKVMYMYVWMDSRLREKYKLAMRDIIKKKRGGKKVIRWSGNTEESTRRMTVIFDRFPVALFARA